MRSEALKPDTYELSLFDMRVSLVRVFGGVWAGNVALRGPVTLCCRLRLVRSLLAASLGSACEKLPQLMRQLCDMCYVM